MTTATTSRVKASKYTIHDSTEETDCDYCGSPMYVGDPAVMTSEEKVFCSHKCATWEHYTRTGEKVSL